MCVCVCVCVCVQAHARVRVCKEEFYPGSIESSSEPFPVLWCHLVSYQRERTSHADNNISSLRLNFWQWDTIGWFCSLDGCFWAKLNLLQLDKLIPVVFTNVEYLGDLVPDKHLSIYLSMYVLMYSVIIPELQAWSKRVRTAVDLLCSLLDNYPWERYKPPYPLRAKGWTVLLMFFYKDGFDIKQLAEVNMR